MVVTQTLGDTKPTMYVSTITSSKGPGALILRSADGLRFVPVTARGMGNADVNSFRALVGLNRRLYASPSGKGRQWAFTGSPVVLESSNPASGQWRAVSAPGFGDDTNQVIFEMTAFNGHLYAGTGNPTNGYQVWKTRPEGSVPYSWKKVITNGAYRGTLNQAVISMFAFDNALYVGSGIRRGGYDREFNTGPAPAELIRIHPDDSWDLVVGDRRSTPDGLKSPLSHLGPGFGNPFTGYIWSMAEYDGFLYLGTYDSAVLLSFVDVQKLSPAQRGRLNSNQFNRTVDRQAGFDLWSSSDGVHWNQITRDGFGNKYNYGVRTLLGTPQGLFLGAANPFGPKIAAETSGGWRYVPNPRGGLEVWKGMRDCSEQLAAPSKADTLPGKLGATINRHYDNFLYIPLVEEFFEGSDFANFGFWDEHTASPREASENLVDKLLAFTPDMKGTILDVACGKGATTRRLLKYYPPTAITGINISEKQLATCRSNAPGCRFLLMSATDLKFDDNSFDNIICVEAAFHFKTREAFLSEAFRVLKPGGHLFLTDMLFRKWVVQVGPLLCPENYIADPKEYGDLLARIGFDDVHVMDATRQCWVSWNTNYLVYLRQSLAIGRIGPSRFRALAAERLLSANRVHFYILAAASKPVGNHEAG
jgi:SAM-dependent methyltransferase